MKSGILSMLDHLGWTEARIALLKKLWKEGRSARQIAAVLGGGATRNSVVGKAHRLRLSARARPQRTSVRATPSTREREGTARSIVRSTRGEIGAGTVESSDAEGLLPYLASDGDIDAAALIGILDLTDRTCRFPIGDRQQPTFGFCGKRTVDGRPYCDDHDRRAHRTVEQSRERQDSKT